MSEPEWLLPFVPLPEWTRESAPADFQARVERYVAWRESNDKTPFDWTHYAATSAQQDQIQAAADAHLPQIPVGPLSAEDHRLIQQAYDAGQIDHLPTDRGNYPDFTGHVVVDVKLPPELWQASDAQQFRYLNEHLFSGELGQTKIFPWDDEKKVESHSPPHGYTWHHHQQPGRMQLVSFEAHNSTGHSGGRQVWAGDER